MWPNDVMSFRACKTLCAANTGVALDAVIAKGTRCARRPRRACSALAPLRTTCHVSVARERE